MGESLSFSWHSTFFLFSLIFVVVLTIINDERKITPTFRRESADDRQRVVRTLVRVRRGDGGGAGPAENRRRRRQRRDRILGRRKTRRGRWLGGLGR